MFLVTSQFLTVLIGLGFDSGFAIFITEHKHRNQTLLNYLFTKSLLVSLGVLIIIGSISFSINYYFNYFSNLECCYLIIYVLTFHISASIYNFIRWLGNAKMASVIIFMASSIGVCNWRLYRFF